MGKFISEFKDKLIIITILVMLFDLVVMSSEVYADESTATGQMVANCGQNYDENGQNPSNYCPEMPDESGEEYKVKPYTYSDGKWDLGIWRYPDEEVQQEISAVAIAAANNNNIGYCWGHRETFWQEAQKVDYNPADITAYCEADCSSSSGTVVKIVGARKNMDALLNLVITDTTGMVAQLTAAGFENIGNGGVATMQAGDICVSSGHATIYVGDATASTVTGSGSYDTEEVNLDRMQTKLKYKGLPTTVTYSGSAEIPNVFELIKGLLDWIVGLLFLGLKIVVMGFTELFENIVSNLLHEVQEVKISS